MLDQYSLRIELIVLSWISLLVRRFSMSWDVFEFSSVSLLSSLLSIGSPYKIKEFQCLYLKHL